FFLRSDSCRCLLYVATSEKNVYRLLNSFFGRPVASELLQLQREFLVERFAKHAQEAFRSVSTVCEGKFALPSCRIEVVAQCCGDRGWALFVDASTDLLLTRSFRHGLAQESKQYR